LLFLLTDHQGRALLITQTGCKAEADAFGRNHLPSFRESIEIDRASHAQAQEFWQVRTVRLMKVQLNAEGRTKTSSAVSEPKRGASMKQIWVRGPKLPEEVESDGLLTPEDHRDLTLDHIARTSDVVVRIEITKRA
jgi:hypothetical protein